MVKKLVETELTTSLPFVKTVTGAQGTAFMNVLGARHGEEATGDRSDAEHRRV